MGLNVSGLGAALGVGSAAKQHFAQGGLVVALDLNHNV